MGAPRWACALLRRVASRGEAEDVIGDLEESYRRRRERHGRLFASAMTSFDALDMARAVLRARFRREGWRGQGRKVSADGGRNGGGVSWLDVKLGIRMLAKYPGLSVVGGLGMAVAIAIAAAYTGVLKTLLYPTVPLPEGERIVALQNWDPRISNKNIWSLHDMLTWREELSSVQDVGAHRTITRNLVAEDGTAEPLAIAEMSAAGFRVARVAPLLGRPLLDEDEREGSPQVMVIGYDIWQRRFAADPEIVGRETRLGTALHTIVGVMPEGFAFPINHRIWIPLRLNPSEYARGAGPALSVFGRLSPGVTLSEARAEMELIGQRAAAAFPETHGHLRAQVQPYTYAFSDMDDPENVLTMRLFQVFVSLLLVVVCVNVAILVYARTAIRRGEILVRTALGASRWRVVAQLFAEALVLASISAGAGVLLAGVALGQANVFAVGLTGRLPFWMDFGLAFDSVVYAVILAVLAAVITGVVPALQATGRGLQTGLQQLSAGGSGMLLGRTWTALIIGQVAFVVALLPTAVYVSTETIRHGIQDPGFATDEYLTALLYMERDAEEERQSAAQSDAYRAEFGAHYGDRLTELLRRLRAERDVRAATYASTVPGREGPMWIEIEDQTEAGTADGLPQSERYGLEARYARVDVDFFAAFDVPILAGRSFIRTDADTTASAVIVNRSFVQQFLGDANALGRRFRRAGLSRETRSDAELYRWFEIVGVVPDFPNATEPDEAAAVVYQAASPDQIYPARLAVRMREGSPASFTGRLTQVTSALDLALQLRIVRPLDTIYAEDQKTMRWIGVGIAVVILSVLLLCAAGISAMTSFTVSRRRREIGIRAALGAYPRRLLANMFAGVAVRLSLGVGVGLGASLLLDVLMDGEMLFGNRSLLFVAVSAIMVIVGLLATIGPARRGLRIQPTEALRQE